MFDLYKKTTVGDATTYVRPFQTISYGPLGVPTSMSISEEMVVVLSDASTLNFPITTGALQATITDPSQAFNVVDPTNGAIVGTKTFAQLKIDLYSLYLYLAAIRDAG